VEVQLHVFQNGGTGWRRLTTLGKAPLKTNRTESWESTDSRHRYDK